MLEDVKTVGETETPKEEGPPVPEQLKERVLYDFLFLLHTTTLCPSLIQSSL